jgi:hypothetical protein
VDMWITVDKGIVFCTCAGADVSNEGLGLGLMQALPNFPASIAQIACKDCARICRRGRLRRKGERFGPSFPKMQDSQPNHDACCCSPIVQIG